MKWNWLFCLCLSLIPPGAALAVSLDDIEEEETETEDSGSNPFRVEWSGVVDFRLVSAGKAKNWADAHGDWGGPGLTRYGTASGTERKETFQLGMIAMVMDVYTDDELSAHIQLNQSDHQTGAGTWGELGVAEAFVSERFGPAEFKLGFLIPPISLEHPETAWGTRYSITPSAINTWVGEELRGLGLETSYSFNDNIDALLATFSHNDAIATVLTYRGWALHDYQGTYGTRLRWNWIPEEINPSNGWVEPFKEIDDKLGLYGKLSLHTATKQSKVEAFYYNNFANPSRFDGINYAWKTDFWNLSLAHSFAFGLEVLAQIMQGKTRMGSIEVVAADFNASYLMTSYRKGAHRGTLRYDTFEVIDTDDFVFPSGAINDNNSHGTALTAAYLYHLSDSKMLGAEYVAVDSRRDASAEFKDKDPDDDLFQLMYRLNF